MVKPIAFLIGDPGSGAYSQRDDEPSKDGNIHLQRAIDLTVVSPFWAERGHAIEAYAQFEQSLCKLFAYTSGAPNTSAVIIFFKQTNTGARNATLEKLIKNKFGNEYNNFWNSFFNLSRSIDTKRNEIVHWITACIVAMGDDDHMLVGLNLVPPALEIRDKNTPFISLGDLKDFQDKCGVFTQLCNIFCLLEQPDFAQDPSWHDIYRRQLIYPLPEDHRLLCRTAAKH